MHYVDLNIQTKNIHRDMLFLITNIGNKDIVLRYPWLSTFKPQFDWTHAVIHEKALPIVIQSVNPHIPGKEPIIAATKTQQTIFGEFLQKHTIQATTSTDLAIAVQQYTQKVEVPKNYHKFAKVFSEEESKWYPPVTIQTRSLLFFMMTHYLTRAGTPMTHIDSDL